MCSASFISNTKYLNFRPIVTPNCNYFQKVIILRSWRTLYRWIYEKYLVNGNLKVLHRKGKRHGNKETLGKYSEGKTIRKRNISAKMPDRRAETMENAVVTTLSAFPPQLVKTITCVLPVQN